MNFNTGIWDWDNINKELYFISNIEQDVATKTKNKKNISKETATKRQSDNALNIYFKEAVDGFEQIMFKKNFQRKVFLNKLDVVTIQDIRDVVLFSCPKNNLSQQFINFFHTPTMDRLLRALVIYFQYYIQVYETLMQRREEKKSKLYHPLAVEYENMLKENLIDLRSMVAREYCLLLKGSEETKPFHHLNKYHISLSVRDYQLYELLYQVLIRFVWIALLKRNYNLIEIELNRMFRSNTYNIVSHKNPEHILSSLTNEEMQVLNGECKNDKEYKLLIHSSVAKEIINGSRDFRMLAIGNFEMELQDRRLKHLELLYTLPEESFSEFGFNIGILGYPKMYFDVMLNAKVIKMKKDEEPKQLELSKIEIPLQTTSSMDDVANAYLTKSTENRSIIKPSTEIQRKIWQKYIKIK